MSIGENNIYVRFTYSGVCINYNSYEPRFWHMKNKGARQLRAPSRNSEAIIIYFWKTTIFFPLQ